VDMDIASTDSACGTEHNAASICTNCKFTRAKQTACIDIATTPKILSGAKMEKGNSCAQLITFD
jgi:hypothetical protein